MAALAELPAGARMAVKGAANRFAGRAVHRSLAETLDGLRNSGYRPRDKSYIEKASVPEKSRENPIDARRTIIVIM